MGRVEAQTSGFSGYEDGRAEVYRPAEHVEQDPYSLRAWLV